MPSIAAIVIATSAVLWHSVSVRSQSPNTEVTKEQFERWMTDLSNWGRWGKDDERGGLNLITAEKRRQAATLGKTGTIVSLSREIARHKPAAGPEPRPVNRGGAMAHHFATSSSPNNDGDYLFERQEVEYHGGTLSHFDALCHVAYKGKNYNGFVYKDIVTMDGGCSKLAVTNAKDGIVTRGLLLDMPDLAVRRADVEAWEKKTGLRVSSGDALLLRTKRPGSAKAGGGGYHPSLIPFLKERDIALLGADVPQEGGQIPGVSLPMHFFTLVALGVNLLDNLALDELADTAAKLKRWEFMLAIQPLRIERGAGGAINAVALF
jgi:kynurenine formamidase